MYEKVLVNMIDHFCEDKESGRMNRFNSPIFNILDTAVVFGVFSSILEMAEGNIPIVSKRAWSHLVWDRARRLEDANWLSTNMLYKDNDLLANTLGETRYLTWWAISDLDHRLVSMCEDMCKIMCHASLLKRDDCRLKGLYVSNRTCTNCEMYCLEDIHHIVMQCPYYQCDRNDMYDEINKNCPNVKVLLEGDSTNILYYLLGRKLTPICDEEMLFFWCISGNSISRMYRKAIASRTGVG